MSGFAHNTAPKVNMNALITTLRRDAKRQVAVTLMAANAALPPLTTEAAKPFAYAQMASTPASTALTKTDVLPASPASPRKTNVATQPLCPPSPSTKSETQLFHQLDASSLSFVLCKTSLHGFTFVSQNMC